jgi:chorismate-pyruvate lyase
MTECLLAAAEFCRLNRDLQLLIGTNGTLTRILRVVADEEIVVQIIDQKIRPPVADEVGSGLLAGERILQRHVLLKGRSSGQQFVAAESLVAVDLLPRAIATSLTETHCSIGEIMAAGRLETFKEPAEVWVGEIPDWFVVDGHRTPQPRTVGRRYRIISGGRPVIVITEYFIDSLESA